MQLHGFLSDKKAHKKDRKRLATACTDISDST